MSTATLPHSHPIPAIISPEVGAARLVPAGPSLWRVIDLANRVIGHIQVVTDSSGLRYRARRYRSSTRSFRDLGDFWVCEQAVECLRFAR